MRRPSRLCALGASAILFQPLTPYGRGVYRGSEAAVIAARFIVRQIFRIPAVEQDAAAVRVVAQGIDDVVDLVDRPAVPGRPRRPLLSVDRTEFALLGRPLVPDRYPVLVQPADVGVAAEEPDQLVGDALEVELLRRQQRETLRQVMTNLPAEDGGRSRPRAVTLDDAVGENVSEEVVILLHVLKSVRLTSGVSIRPATGNLKIESTTR